MLRPLPFTGSVGASAVEVPPTVEVMKSWIEGLLTSPYTPGNSGVAQPRP